LTKSSQGKGGGGKGGKGYIQLFFVFVEGREGKKKKARGPSQKKLCKRGKGGKTVGPSFLSLAGEKKKKRGGKVPHVGKEKGGVPQPVDGPEEGRGKDEVNSQEKKKGGGEADQSLTTGYRTFPPHN